MSQSHSTRRDFLKTSTLAAAGATLPYWFTTGRTLAEQAARSPNERLTIGCIGTGDRWKQDPYSRMKNYGDVVSLCDVDQNHLREALDKVSSDQRAQGREPQIETHEDYRKVLDRKDIDTVVIVTPDHWHSKIAIDAMEAGKDVYCEKPLTLTIDEGKQIIKVLEKTKRVFQVGTQQRSEMNQRFITAIALARSGRIGKLKKLTCDIGTFEESGAIPVATVPDGLNWEMWLGQAPLVDFRFKDNGKKWGNSRCHYEFRWWYEYSGGKLTDWGAHHVDIAQWAIEQNGPGQGPISVEPVVVEHPSPMENGMPTQDDRYNCAHKFDVKVMFPGEVEMRIVSQSPDNNGILFEGTDGRFHVSRGGMKGAIVEDLKTNPLPPEALEKVYGGPIPANHQENFVNCIKTRARPISDVWSHHRAMTTCHLANIALRLNETLAWDAKKEEITNSARGRAMQAREQRKGYEINVPV
ncbi:Gfo/Idh/MocA family oxidoreductase [Planctomicrobium piriforme]|uniref:Tat (Twin-arginine translocation) pathway signal sequence n=1 Tax=Planctomicrobium piriforme TaxID=1576369 RepID=A0A1I3AZJ0_9PLAN|nr:Gfo/Idh/MocA family oxidoreductase [Planctomicrobium piriforme]SFH55473.1 Tat (twin-arginine translocation) pathway signal sequence [Planctomicrobium piriforme]